MRRVFTDRDEADARGAQAAADLRRTHSLEVAAASMAGRLETLREMVSPESVLARDPSPVFHAAGLARRAVPSSAAAARFPSARCCAGCGPTPSTRTG